MRNLLRCTALAALALTLVACGSTGGRGGTGEVVSLNELPESHRELLAAYGRGGPEWEERRAALRDQPELASFLAENLVVELVRAHGSLGARDGGRARSAFDRAQRELALIPSASVPVLIELVEVGDGIVATLATETLARFGPRAALPLAARLGKGEPVTRRRIAQALEGVAHAGDDEPAVLDALAARLERDSDWSVRAQVARTIGARGARSRSTERPRALLEVALRDPDPIVARYAAEAMAALGDPRGVPALVRGLERGVAEGELQLVQACQAALAALTGVRGELDGRGWRDWWRENAPAQR